LGSSTNATASSGSGSTTTNNVTETVTPGVWDCLMLSNDQSAVSQNSY